MNDTLLVTRPHHDDTTFYCSEWAEDVIKFAKEKNFNVIDLKGERASRQNVESYIISKTPSLIFFNGHGNENIVAGHKNEMLIGANTNHHLLKNKIVHSLSCNSAKNLGAIAVKNGTRSYIGYANDFVFFHDKNKSAHPKQDNVSKPFFDSANQVPLNLLNRKTVIESVNGARKSYEEWIAYYRLHGEILEAPQNLVALIWNKSSLVFHGNPEAKIY